jgi:hypothetical protein
MILVLTQQVAVKQDCEEKKKTADLVHVQQLVGRNSIWEYKPGKVTVTLMAAAIP